MSSFRASPWVTYEPASSHHNRQQPVSEEEMDQDVDMDAPQISTLREENTPPPQPQKKVTTNIKKRISVPALTVEQRSRNAGMKEQDEDEEEDQLVDELIDDVENNDVRSVDNPQKRKFQEPIKARKLRKGEKKAVDGEKKVKEKVSQPTGAHNLAPTMSCFKATPPESHEDTEITNTSLVSPAGETSRPKARIVYAPSRQPSGSSTMPRGRIKLAKQKSAIPPLLLEDAGVLSESYAGTAASSPVTAQFEQNSPDPENIVPSSPPPPVSAALVEEPNLENVPIPVYPLPTKPFPVQPPQKMPSGIAPILPLDKGNKKVRRWREANREIRGIAGGRWLARTWVGGKESEYASHISAARPADDKTSSSVTLPKLSSVSISAPASMKALSKLKASSKGGSAITSSNPSRAPSANPETQSIPITCPVRAPTKMRILQLAPSSEGGDSEMTHLPRA